MRKIDRAQPEPQLSEGDVKKAVADWLQYQENLGNLISFRLNAGSFILTGPDGSFRRRVQGAKAGTADYLVIQSGTVQAQYLGQLRGEPHRICFATFIEIKSTKGKTTKEQDEFAEKVKKFNCRYYIVKSVTELQEILKL